MSAKERQEGGSHYKNMPIQPVDFITKNRIPFLEGCVIKRMCRWRAKDGLKDLRKAIHEIELLIEANSETLKQDTISQQAIEAFKQAFGTDKPIPPRPVIKNKACPRCGAGEGELCRDWDHAKDECPERATRGPQGVSMDSLCAVDRAPAADSTIPGVCVPEGEMWPQDATNGTRILSWRPRKPGDPGTHLYGWVEIGFMWDGELVRYEPQS